MFHHLQNRNKKGPQLLIQLCGLRIRWLELPSEEQKVKEARWVDRGGQPRKSVPGPITMIAISPTDAAIIPSLDQDLHINYPEQDELSCFCFFPEAE